MIFTDETSVQKGNVRGKRRVWRKKDKTYHNHVITCWWKGFLEFMWWSCFLYDEKGPYYIWEKQTAKEKQECEEDLNARNAACIKECRKKFKAEQREKRRTRQGHRGVEAMFTYNEHQGGYVLKKGRGKIN